MISIVIPLFNEEESLETLFGELKSSLDKNRDYEIIFVDDGSTDESLRVLKHISAKDKRVKIFSFRNNRGKAEALHVGFQKAKGDYIVTLDADLQDSPAEMHKLLVKAKEGWDVVCGWRKRRHDALSKVISSRSFNFLARLFWNLSLHDYNCGLKVYTKDAAKSLPLYGGMHRFIPLLLHEQGFKVCEAEVVHRERKYGKSKYGLSKLWKDMPDLVTMLFLVRYGKRPLHFFGIIGFILIIPGVLILIYLAGLKLVGLGIGDRPILFLGMLLVISGLQVFFTGFLADLIINISQKSHTQSEDSIIKYSSEE